MRSHMSTHVRKEGDIPPSVALIGLVFILGLLAYLEYPKKMLFYQNQIDRYADAHLYFLGGVVLSFSINAMGAGAMISKLFGINQQGSRLALLSKRSGNDTRKPHDWRSISLAISAGVLV